MQIDRRTVGVFVVGALGALALVLSAATLTSAGGGSGGWIGLGGNGSSLFSSNETVEMTGDSPVPPFVWTAASIALVALLVGVLALSVYVLEARDLLEVIVISIMAAVLFWLLLQAVFSLSGESTLGGSFGMGGSSAGDLGTAPGDSSGTQFSLLLFGGLGVAAVLALTILLGLSDEDTPPEPDATASHEETDLRTVGRAAGRAADDIATGERSTANAVYRAWVEMTDALDVSNREARTPGEFAETAIEAGMDADDVAELTRLFEDVRYGDAPVSEERAERARQALRRVESTYVGESE